jgi:predicted glutamine amidotransferase
LCELLGISVSPPAQMGLYFKAFRPRAIENISGWGVGWYEDSKAQVIKEAVRADQSARALELQNDPPTSATFIIHVRAATVGDISDVNTHPFTEELNNKSWIFAHNGTVKNLETLPRGGYVAKGETDSEAAFHYLLSRLVDASNADEELDAVASSATELSKNGKANFLLTDGNMLYVYYDGHKTLHYIERVPNELTEGFEGSDDDYSIDLEGAPGGQERAVVCASVPITSDAWTAMSPGELLVCRDGVVAQRMLIPHTVT